MRVITGLVSLLLATSAIAGDGWERVGIEDGIVVEARDVAGSSLREVRATVHVDVPPAAIAAVVWRYEDHASFLPRLRHAEVLRDAGDERIVYEQIALPLLRDRDVVLRAQRAVDGASGTIDIRSMAIADEGPPETSRFVRVRTSAGHWHLVPAGGGTDVTYLVRSDVGGTVPAWLVNRAQREAVPDLVRAMLARAQAEGVHTDR
jgi:hypothetical protein